MTREKHVYRTNEIAGLFLRQYKTSARNQQGNYYFNGNTLYSYGSHFICVQIHSIAEKKYLFINDAGYSVTTAKHKLYGYSYDDFAVIHFKNLQCFNYHFDIIRLISEMDNSKADIQDLQGKIKRCKTLWKIKYYQEDIEHKNQNITNIKSFVRDYIAVNGYKTITDIIKDDFKKISSDDNLRDIKIRTDRIKENKAQIKLIKSIVKDVK